LVTLKCQQNLEEDIRVFLRASGDSIVIGKTFHLDYYGIGASFHISDPELEEAARRLSRQINDRLWLEPIYEDSLRRHTQPERHLDASIRPSYRKALAKRIRKIAKHIRRYGDTPTKKALARYPGLYDTHQLLPTFLIMGGVLGIISGAVGGVIGSAQTGCFASSIITGILYGILLGTCIAEEITSTRQVRHGIIIGSMLGCVLGFAGGFVWLKIFYAIAGNIASGFLGGVIVGAISGIGQAFMFILVGMAIGRWLNRQ
jgi:hypothetical protein